MKQGDFLQEKLDNFKNHIKTCLKPVELRSKKVHENIEFILKFSLDDWLEFASKHLVPYQDDLDSATKEIIELYDLDVNEEQKHKIKRYLELFIDCLTK